MSLLGIRETTFRYWLEKGIIPHTRAGRYNIFDKQKLLELKSEILDIEDVREKIKKEREELEKRLDSINKEKIELEGYSSLSKIYEYNWRKFIERRMGERRREYDMLLDYLDGAHFYEIAEKWDLSRERINQLVGRAIRSLRASWPDVQEIKELKQDREKLRLENNVLRDKLKKLGLHKEAKTKEGLPAVFLTKVRDYNWSFRTLNCLKSADIDTIGDLCQKNPTSIMRYRNFGKKSLREVVEKLEDMGLTLGMDLSVYDYEQE